MRAVCAFLAILWTSVASYDMIVHSPGAPIEVGIALVFAVLAGAYRPIEKRGR